MDLFSLGRRTVHRGSDAIDVHQLVLPTGDLEVAEALGSAFLQIENVAVGRQRIVTDFVRTHDRENLRNTALKGPGGFESEPRPYLFERDAVVAFIDERVIGRDLGVRDLLFDELGEVA